LQRNSRQEARKKNSDESYHAGLIASPESNTLLKIKHETNLRQRVIDLSNEDAEETQINSSNICDSPPHYKRGTKQQKKESHHQASSKVVQWKEAEYKSFNPQNPVSALLLQQQQNTNFPMGGFLTPFTTQQINTTLTLPMHLHSFSASAAESIWQPPNQPFYYKPSINAAAPQCIKSLQCLVSTPENLNKRESVRELLTSQSSLSSQFLPSQSKSRRISQRRKNRYIKCASFKFQKNINTNLLQAQQFT
jgi:hypothetical protein